MIFNDNESLSELYSNISKHVEPSKEQLTRQAPLISNTGLSKDQGSLQEAYEVMTSKGHKKCTCMHAAKGCDCDGCEECRSNREQVSEAKKDKANKPDYMDVDEDGDKKESMKKALKDKEMKESSKFKSLFLSIINEQKVCGCSINSDAQYNCVMDDGTKKVLKGESVIKMKDRLKSVKPAHKK